MPTQPEHYVLCKNSQCRPISPNIRIRFFRLAFKDPHNQTQLFLFLSTCSCSCFFVVKPLPALLLKLTWPCIFRLSWSPILRKLFLPPHGYFSPPNFYIQLTSHLFHTSWLNIAFSYFTYVHFVFVTKSTVMIFAFWFSFIITSSVEHVKYGISIL